MLGNISIRSESAIKIDKWLLIKSTTPSISFFNNKQFVLKQIVNNFEKESHSNKTIIHLHIQKILENVILNQPSLYYQIKQNLNCKLNKSLIVKYRMKTSGIKSVSRELLCRKFPCRKFSLVKLPSSELPCRVLPR